MKIKCPACNEILEVNPSMSAQTMTCRCGKKLRVRTSNQKPSSPASSVAARRFKGSDGLTPQSQLTPQGFDTVSTQKIPSTTPLQNKQYEPTSVAFPHKQTSPPQAPSSGLAITSLVLGTVSFLGLFFQCCSGFLLIFPVSVALPCLIALPALAFGVVSIKKADRGEAGGKQMAIAGVVTGGLVLALTALLIVTVVVLHAYQEQP